MRFLVMLSRWNDIFFFCVHLRSWRFDHRKLQIFCFVLRAFIAESLQLSWETILLSFVKLFDLCEFPADLTVATTPCFEYRLIFQKLIIDINNLSPVQRMQCNHYSIQRKTSNSDEFRRIFPDPVRQRFCDSPSMSFPSRSLDPMRLSTVSVRPSTFDIVLYEF